MAVKLIYQVKARLGGQLGLLSRARKLARRCHHTLRNLDDVGHACAVRSGLLRDQRAWHHVGAEEAGVRLDLIGGS
jgi:hypothetical protein